MSTGAGGRDAGVATVLAAVLILGLLVILGFGLALGSAVLARHRAEGAADLAALAAASHATAGGTAACEQAERVARGMHASVLDCRLSGPDARVIVAERTSALPGLLSSQVSARARAGPAPR
ncbi:MAG: flp pilus-assembly TadE/G-like family protein [Saccharopolyspora sp.]|uniref:Rv3654c family TadE-like protein n=1 Tax=Saccharopolyspora TaxID=1835 RepID=UPI00190D886B|nr:MULTISPECIES: Rv3654c family TadE-like protein [unclassified Saccharopolyspora]MBQ6641088.1 flp pilus-assembly TadE/G-like family protein [Saccharopolyspora sp.]